MQNNLYNLLRINESYELSIFFIFKNKLELFIFIFLFFISFYINIIFEGFIWIFKASFYKSNINRN
jgi:hypothetical protein